jgi:hypothetical protein
MTSQETRRPLPCEAPARCGAFADERRVVADNARAGRVNKKGAAEILPNPEAKAGTNVANCASSSALHTHLIIWKVREADPKLFAPACPSPPMMCSLAASRSSMSGASSPADAKPSSSLRGQSRVADSQCWKMWSGSPPKCLPLPRSRRTAECIVRRWRKVLKGISRSRV